MIRGMTLLWAGLALSVGCGLFLVKHQVQGLEDDLRALHRTIATDREAIHVARAEWAYLNAPDRLAELAGKHLDLGPVDPTHITTVAALPLRGATGGGQIYMGAAPGKPTAKPRPELAAAPATTQRRTQ